MSILKRLSAIAQRSSLLGTVFALVAATVVPALVPLSTYADQLNPLTERSLTLSSSSPGWQYTDGSGNSTYAPPNSGANGQKTGETFSFKVTTDTSAGNPDSNPAIKGFSFQYCTGAAGTCTAPGDGTSAGHSDLEVVTSSPTEVPSAIGTYIDGSTGNVTAIPNEDGTGGSYAVINYDPTANDGDGGWVQSTGWTWTAVNKEDGAGATGKANYSILTNSTSGLEIPTGTQVKVIFFGTDDNYITNPGSGAFFVKINDYKSASLTAALLTGGTGTPTSTPTADFATSDIVDGGVTVANVMNQSIEIQTKVLETMDFSVGTVDPDTLSEAQLTAATGDSTHGQCNPILTSMGTGDAVDTLLLGDGSQENSLSTAHTYSTHSYFRLSSNSSKGAVVYYSGATLSDTEGDQIAPIGTDPTAPSRGTPQFGLALDNTQDGGSVIGTGSTNNAYPVDYSTERDTITTDGTTTDYYYENGADNDANGLTPSVADTNGVTSTPSDGVDASTTTDTNNTGFHTPYLYPLAPATTGNGTYADGTGVINPDFQGTSGGTQVGDGTSTVNTKFAFDPNSEKIPTPLASESDQVVDCITGKVRYVANIAATTPAGIYTTKINYIAAPQY